MKSQKLSVNELILFLIQKRPDLVQEMAKSDHNYDLNNLSPYHMEGSVWTHTLMVLNQAESKNLSDLAKIACLVHDLGKPISRFVNYEKKRVLFQGHDGASCYLMINLLFELGLSLEEIKTLIIVVSKHQYLYQYFNEATLSKEQIKLISSYFKNYKKEFEILLELADCDNEGRISDKKRNGIKNYFEPILNEIQNEDSYSLNKLDFKIGIGLPGCGKSTFAKTLNNYLVLSRDRCAEELFGDYSKISKDQLYSSEVDGLFFSKLNESLKRDSNIFIDKTNLSQSSQRSILSSVSSKKYNKSCVVFMKDFDLLKKDLKIREEKTGKRIPFNDLKKFLKSFSAPMYNVFDKIEYKIFKEGDY